MTLHEWFYEIVAEICYDREYLYPCFVLNFSDFMQGLYRQAGIQPEGDYRAAGLKSGRDALFAWRMTGKKLDLFGSNHVHLTCRIVERASQRVEEIRQGVFDLTTGRLQDDGGRQLL